MSITGTIIGYDPGGNTKHGLAISSYEQGDLKSVNVDTYKTAYDVIYAVGELDNVIAIGVDTLTCWSTGKSGWRSADRWLRKNYNEVSNSIVAANSLYSSMSLNGMSVLLSLLEMNPCLHISETHPKVLYYALKNEKYDYSSNHKVMDEFLSSIISTKKIQTANDHEWDAVLSIYAAKQGLCEQWTNDLHIQPHEDNECLIEPCGKTHYWWPLPRYQK